MGREPRCAALPVVGITTEAIVFIHLQGSWKEIEEESSSAARELRTPLTSVRGLVNCTPE